MKNYNWLQIGLILFILFGGLTACQEAGSSGSEPTRISEVEPNGDKASAMAITPDGTVVEGSINPGDDEDYYRFPVELGSDYRITATWTSGDNLDLYVELYIDESATSAYDIDNTAEQEDEQEVITVFRTTEATFCYVNVSEFHMSTNTGTYTLAVQKI